MRVLNILIIAALIMAASTVYKIKFDATLQAEKVNKVASEVSQQRNAIAALRAEASKLQTPDRIQELAQRFLKLEPVKATQFNNFDNLPAKPPALPSGPAHDAIADLLSATPDPTGSLAQPAPR